MRRISLLAILLLAILVASGCGQYGKRYTGKGDNTKAASGKEEQVTDEKFDAAARKKDGCTELEEFESEGSTHIDAAESATYEHNPPHSGDHWNDAAVPAPAEWGLYDTTLDDEVYIHNLEHGHIAISHKGLTDKQRDELIDMVRINSYHLVLHPRKANPKPGVYFTAWTAELYCRTPSAAALQYMIDNWRDQGPELFTDDAGGGDMGSDG